MQYDSADRLVQVDSPMFGTAQYSYDKLDNLTRVTIGGPAARDHWYCYDARNQLTNIKSGTCATGATVIGLGYDEQGNLNNKSGIDYVFDYGNRLRSSEAGASSYVYDGWGRRVRDVANGASKYSFYSREGQLVYAQDLRQAKQSNYFYLGGSLVAIREQPTGGTAVALYQHTDALGSPVAVTDAARTIVEKSQYEPYGGLLNRPLEDGPGYTGHVSDAVTGLSYMQQRYYDPKIGGGRFLSVDPVTATSVGGNFNRYWYANNNPYKFKDPDGRLPCGEILPCPKPQDPKLAHADKIVANDAKMLVGGVAATWVAGAGAAVAVTTGAVAATSAAVGKAATAAEAAYATGGVAVYAKGREAVQVVAAATTQVATAVAAKAGELKVAAMTSPAAIGAMKHMDKIVDAIDGLFNPGPPPMSPAGIIAGVAASPESVIKMDESDDP